MRQGFSLAATVALLTALSYAELVTMFPKAGADYIYFRNAFSQWRWIATTTGIMMAFAGCASAAAVSLAFASYAQHFIELPNILVASGLLVFFAGINIVGLRESSWINAGFTMLRLKSHAQSQISFL